MTDEQRIAFLEQRADFLEAALAKTLINVGLIIMAMEGLVAAATSGENQTVDKKDGFLVV